MFCKTHCNKQPNTTSEDEHTTTDKKKLKIFFYLLDVSYLVQMWQTFFIESNTHARARAHTHTHLYIYIYIYIYTSMFSKKTADCFLFKIIQVKTFGFSSYFSYVCLKMVKKAPHTSASVFNHLYLFIILSIIFIWGAFFVGFFRIGLALPVRVDDRVNYWIWFKR